MTASVASKNPLATFARSTVGRKMFVAVTGLLLLGFVVGHLAGNLLIFQGPEALNSYAYFLKSKPALVWAARIGLLAFFFLHLWSALTLNLKSRDARPQRYHMYKPLVATFASRTMVQTGLVVLAFVIFHLLHFTLGVTHPDHYSLTTQIQWQGATTEVHDVFSMVVRGFQQPLVAMSYIVAMVMLGLHLSHGIPSMLQTIGFNHPVYTPLVRKAGVALAVLLAAGNIAIPVSVLAGFVGGGGNS